MKSALINFEDFRYEVASMVVDAERIYDETIFDDRVFAMWELGMDSRDVATAIVNDAHMDQKMLVKVDPFEKSFMRHGLFVEECKRRGVRFLPLQVMLPVYRAAGL